MNSKNDALACRISRVTIARTVAVICGIVFCGAVTCFALDITTLQGKTYTDVQIRRVEPDGISIKHSCGIDKIFIRELTPGDRERFHLDASRAAAYSEAQRQSIEAGRLRQEAIARKQAAELQDRDAQRRLEEKRRKAQADLQATWTRSARRYDLYCWWSGRDGEVCCRGTNGVDYVIYGYSAMPDTWFRVKAVPMGRVQTGSGSSAIQLMLDPSVYPPKLSTHPQP